MFADCGVIQAGFDAFGGIKGQRGSLLSCKSQVD
jgi:hypothetical protein